MKCPPKEHFIYTFNPVIEGGYNIVMLLCGAALTFVFALVSNPKAMPLLVLAVSISIIGYRAHRWYYGWLSREWDFAQFDIKQIEKSDLSDEEKKQRIADIENQPSTVWFSYFWFFLPFVLLVASCIWLVNGFHGN